jgi:hypothetical protein
MKRILFLLLFALIFSTQSELYSQKKVEKITLKNISGTSVGGESESLIQVKNRAINKAKTNALKKGGISENIKTYTDYFQSETDEEYEELFASNIFTNIQGAVKNVEVTNTQRSFTEDGMLQISVRINCVVLKYLTDDDLTFNFWIEGIEPNYDNNENLEFDFRPASEGFLKAFIFTKSDAYQLYPNEYQPSRKFYKDEKYKFPLVRSDDYKPKMEVDYILTASRRSEMHRIVFVFMKEDIPYTGKVEYEKIFDWIFSIPPDLREIKSYSFTVFNKSVAE